MPPALTRSQFLAILPADLTPNTLRSRNFRGETMLAYRSTARGVGRGEDEFNLLDPVAIRLVEALTPKISNIKTAAELTSQFWPLWSDAVAIAESFPSGEHCYLVVASVGGHFEAMIGPLAQAVARLPKASQLVAVDVHVLLADLKADAEAVGVPLPRLTPIFGTEDYFTWREGIEGPAKVELMRAAVKGKTVVDKKTGTGVKGNPPHARQRRRERP